MVGGPRHVTGVSHASRYPSLPLTDKKIWSEDELAGLVDYVARNPEVGDVIPGTGGVRKLRWGRARSGKRGGARVVYFYFHANCPLYLLLA
jgi:hypothetical protein